MPCLASRSPCLASRSHRVPLLLWDVEISELEEPCPPLFKCFCTQLCTLDVSYSADWSKFRGFFWSQMDSKAISSMGHGQLWRHPGLPSQGTLSCSAAASHEVSFPDSFMGFQWAAAARSTFIPHIQTSSSAFPDTRNLSASFPSPRTHLPALLQPRNLYHLLNHIYEHGGKKKNPNLN